MPINIGDFNDPTFVFDGNLQSTLGPVTSSMAGSSEDAPTDINGSLNRALGQVTCRFSDEALTDYPRTGAYLVGASQGYALDSSAGEYQRTWAAQHDVLVLNMNPTVWGGASAAPAGWLNRQQIVDNIKSKNPRTLIYDYTTSQVGPNDDYGNESTAKLYDEAGPSASAFWDVHDVGVLRNGTEHSGGTDLTPNGPYTSAQLGTQLSDWWGRDGSGRKVSTFNNPSGSNTTWTVNITDYVQPDSNGDRYMVWHAKNVVVPDRLDAHTAIGPGPVGLDGVFLDVFQLKPKSSRNDYNGDGQGDNADDIWDAFNDGHRTSADTLIGGGADAAARWRAGWRTQVDYLQSVYPNISIIANTSNWNPYSYTGITANPLDVQPEYQVSAGTSFPLVSNHPREAIIEGGIKEALSEADGAFSELRVYGNGTGPSASGGGWDLGMSTYYDLMEKCTGRKVVTMFFEVEASDKIGEESGEALFSHLPNAGTPFHLARWGLFFTLMNNGYYYLASYIFGTANSGLYGSACHIDEFGTINTSATGLSKGWLGQPIDGVQTAPRQGTNIWWREFTGGLVVGNTDNNNSAPATTVQIANLPGAPGTFSYLNGVQDASANPGGLLTSNFDLRGVDARFFKRN